MAPAVALGARRLIPVLVTTGAGAASGLPDNFGAAVERLADTFLENAYNVDRKLLLARNAIAERLPEDNYAVVQLFRALRPSSGQLFNAGSYLFFERDAMISMHDAGVRAARSWLAAGPLVDHRGIED
jgi:hypothetical protein